jgi:hypothetical protein
MGGTSNLGKLRAAAVLDELAEEIREPLEELSAALPAGVPVTRAGILGVLRAWRRLGVLSTLSAPARLAIRARYLQAFERILDASRLSPGDFNAAGFKELADIMLRMMERKGYGQVPVRELRGMRGNFAGELFELLGQNYRPLQRDLKYLAVGQVEILNDSKTTLVDANGNPFTMPGEFGEPCKATDITIGGQPFMDLAYVSLLEPPPGPKVDVLSLAVETEFKMPTAAGKAGKQIGRAQVRYDVPKGTILEATVEGRKAPVKVGANQIVFAQNSIIRTLVTPTGTPMYRYSFTARGGYPEHFLRIGVAIDPKAIWQMLDVVMP